MPQPKKIFVLLSRFPYPLEKGDKLRAYHMIRQLSRYFHVHLCAMTEREIDMLDIEKIKPFCHSIKVIRLSRLNILFNLVQTLFSRLPFQAGYFYSHGSQRSINFAIGKIKPDLIFCQLIRMSEYALPHRSIPKWIDYMDAFSEGIKLRIPVSSFFLKFFLKIEYRRLKRYEHLVQRFFNHKTVISVKDAKSLGLPDDAGLNVVPNGIDTSFFTPVVTEKRFDILYAGNMNYPPNISAAVFLSKKIFPEIVSERKSANLLIAGAQPSRVIKNLAMGNISVSGWVDDIRESYAQSRIFIAPMMLSIGMQNKILEAMAMKVPCITTKLANDAIHAEHGKEILVAESPGEFAKHALFLLNNPDEAEKMAANALIFVRKNYDWDRVGEKLNQMLTSSKK